MYVYMLYRLSPLLITFFESCVREPTPTIQKPSYRRSREGSEADPNLTYNPCHADADDDDQDADEEEKGSGEGVYSNNNTTSHIHKRHMNSTTNNHNSIEYSRL